MAARFGNIRYIDPLDAFCVETTCRPFSKDSVYFNDLHITRSRGPMRLMIRSPTTFAGWPVRRMGKA
jgi:hypothetical protein